MKLITAIIKPSKVDDVKAALTSAGVAGMTVTQTSGFGRQRGHTEIYRGSEYTIDFVPKVRLEVLTEDLQVEALTTAIIESAQSGKIGDGKIWVQEVDRVIRIRTGELDSDAI